MKKTIFAFGSVAATTMLLSSFSSGDPVQTSNSNEHSSDEVTIGAQVWMTKNLDVSTFRNGDPIPQVQNKAAWVSAAEKGQPAWCYYKNDSANYAKYGKLFNWYAVTDSRGLAPVGYHIPTDAEWTILTDYLGGESAAGPKMKSANGWPEGYNGTNESGFNGLPGHYRGESGGFALPGGGNTSWWSSTNSVLKKYAYARYLGSESVVERGRWSKAMGFSVRCLKD